MTEQPPRGPIVAELGRPETPQETADRKALASRTRRSNQTVLNLVLSLAVTLGIVLVIVLLVPRGTPTDGQNINFRQVAAQGQGTEPDRLVVPQLPRSWKCNSAQLNQQTSSGVDSWYIGLITPDQQYIGLSQGFHADSGWLAGQVRKSAQTGTRVIDGIRWRVYDNRNNGQDNGNVDYALSTVSGASTYVVYGTAPDADFGTVVTGIADQVKAAGETRSSVQSGTTASTPTGSPSAK